MQGAGKMSLSSSRGQDMLWDLHFQFTLLQELLVDLIHFQVYLLRCDKSINIFTKHVMLTILLEF
jgi:hypothetical protein